MMKFASSLLLSCSLAFCVKSGIGQASEPLIEMESAGYRLNIYTNGNVEFFDDFKFRSSVPRTKTIELEKIRQLIDEFARADFFSLQDSYATGHGKISGGRDVEIFRTNMPGTSLRFTHDGRTKTIIFTVAVSPLWELSNQIDRVVGTSDWIIESQQKR